MTEFNWVGELVQKELRPDDSVVDLGCGIMQSTLDTCPTYPPTRIHCKFLLGIDIHRNYLVFLRKKQVSVLRCDISWILPLRDNSFDVALLLDVLEHLPFDLSFILLMEAERIARKKVIVLTPQKFDPNLDGVSIFPYTGLGENVYQVHKCLVSSDNLVQHGYSVFKTHSKRHAKSYAYAVKDLED